MNVSSALLEIADHLRGLTDTPELDAQVLLAHILDTSRTGLVAHPETLLTAPQADSVRGALSRLEAGEPLPYLLGRWDFFGRQFEITPDVLIPRPETELLVERALTWLQEHRDTFAPLRAADVGTGSGCIAVSLAAQTPNLRVLATDLSRAALNVAHRNAIRFGVHSRVDFIQCDLLPHHPNLLPAVSHFDVICANLPYIPTAALEQLPIYNHEPTLALNGGPDGLDTIRRLLTIAPQWLAPGGLLLIEIESSQGMAAFSLAFDSFHEARIRLVKDLAGNDRLIQVEL
jgi:release factor glutamine methyltransferase